MFNAHNIVLLRDVTVIPMYVQFVQMAIMGCLIVNQSALILVKLAIVSLNVQSALAIGRNQTIFVSAQKVVI